ncbi:MAG: outer membrane lipoprotein carrier protein LolA [Bacteroidota bacterium]|nr:outer membrane lipoprotein carrier protein LolA [Bacteroidota bacterium]
MIKKLLFGLLLLSGFTAFSQSSYIGKNDADAKKILDNVSAKFKTYKSVVASFTLKIENSAGKVQGSKSGVVNMKGSKYRVTISGQEIYSDGNNIWTYDKSSNEVQITKYDGSSNMITPQKMFTNFYDKDFLYKLNGESKVGKKTIQEIELTPVDKTKTFFKVLVGIDKPNQSIVSTKVFEKNGNKYTYSVVSMKTNTNIPDSLFVFDAKKYPNVEVVDLR